MKLGVSGGELDTECPLAMFDAVQVTLSPPTGILTVLDSKVMTVTNGGTENRRRALRRPRLGRAHSARSALSSRSSRSIVGHRSDVLAQIDRVERTQRTDSASSTDVDLWVMRATLVTTARGLRRR